jgi:RNA methyltransferase, TrmH family
MQAGLAARHPEVQALKAMLRDRAARAEAGMCVIEGPRALSGALEREAPIVAVYLGEGAARAFAPIVDRARAAGIRVEQLKEGVLERIGTVRAPQPVLASCRTPRAAVLEDLAVDGMVLVTCGVSDPGNLGTLLRSAEAAGAAGVVSCGGGVDPWNPKVVRASAGAVFGVPLVEEDDPVQVLDRLGARGVRRLGTVARGGENPAVAGLTGGVALVLGNEAHGLPEAVVSRLDGNVTIPMAGHAESLNVAVAGSVLLFEGARQRMEGGR